jgi:hypothetical protein
MKGLTSISAPLFLAHASVLDTQPYLGLGVPIQKSKEKSCFHYSAVSQRLYAPMEYLSPLTVCTAYYEPLNERRWFDPSLRGNRIDNTHIGVDDYWREYDGLEHIGQWYQETGSIAICLWMRILGTKSRCLYPRLINAAPNLAVLQFNRVDFRLPWLRHNFPKHGLFTSIVIHVISGVRLWSTQNFAKTGRSRILNRTTISISSRGHVT